MILSGHSIRRLVTITPFAERTQLAGMSYGVGPASYDFRLAEALDIEPNAFMLGSLVEHMALPLSVGGTVMDKSTLARLGISLFNTWIDPGWAGHLTVEIKNQGPKRVRLPAGSPICQVVFQLTTEPCVPYEGKYMDQPPKPVGAILG